MWVEKKPMLVFMPSNINKIIVHVINQIDTIQINVNKNWT
jgi:hypothetical protein